MTTLAKITFAILVVVIFGLIKHQHELDKMGAASIAQYELNMDAFEYNPNR